MKREPDWMHGGHILKANRKRIGLTQEEVCEMMDINERTYRRWEACASEPSFGMVLTFCESIFKIDVLDAITVARETEIEY